MEEVLLRFAHLGEKIFDLLNDQSIIKCKKVSKTWNSLIADQNSSWIRIIKKYDEKTNKNHKRCPRRWRRAFAKIKFEDLNQFALRLLSIKLKKSKGM